MHAFDWDIGLERVVNVRMMIWNLNSSSSRQLLLAHVECHDGANVALGFELDLSLDLAKEGDLVLAQMLVSGFAS